MSEYILPGFLCGFMLTTGLCAQIAFWKMLAETNAKLPDDKKFSWWWWTLGKDIRLWKEHKRLCADSRWRLVAICSFGSAFAFWILLAASFLGHPR